MYCCPEVCIYTQKSTRIWKVYLNYSKCTWKEKLVSHVNWVSCNQTLDCLRLYGDNRVSRALPRINAYEVLLQHNWLLIFSWHDRFAETHSYLQLSYQITDRLLAAGNNTNMIFYDWHWSSSVPRPNSLWPESYRRAASIQPWNVMLDWLII